MPTLTVKIAAGRTIYDHKGNSLAGNMWLSIDKSVRRTNHRAVRRI